MCEYNFYVHSALCIILIQSEMAQIIQDKLYMDFLPINLILHSLKTLI